MATEELKIRITAEAQDAINKVKAVKDNLTDINKSTGVGRMTSDFQDGANAASKLADKLSSIRNMNLAGLIAGFANVSASMRANQVAAAKLVAETNYYEECIQNSEKAMEQLVKDAQDLATEWYKMRASGSFLGDESQFSEDFSAIADEYAQYSEYLDQDKAKLKSLNVAMDDLKKSGTGAFMGLSKGAAAAAAAVAAVIAAVVALTAAINTAVNASQRIRTDFFDARKVGLTTAAYQEWSYVLGQVGVEADALSDFIKSLSAAQNDLRDGSEDMTKAFKDLGFNIDEVVNMGQEELFAETIKRLQQLEDQVQQTSIAYRIFGEDDAAKVANLMSLNNQEMERMISNFYLLGGAASDSAIEKSIALQGALSNMRLAWQGISNTIGEAVMPALTAVVNAIAKALAWVNMFLRALFGFDIVAKSSGSSGVNKAAASVGGYTSAVKDATAAAKELKRTTMGFDELNIVSNPNTDAGGGSSGADSGGFSGGGGSFEMPELSGLTEDLGLDKMAEAFEKWKGVIQMAVPIAMVAIGLIGGLACLFTGHFIGAIGLFALAGIGFAIGSGNGAWKKLGDGIRKVWEDLKKKVSKTWDDLKKNWKKFWDDLKKNCKEGLAKIQDWFSDKWQKIKEKFNKFCDDVKKGWDKFWSDVSKKVSDGCAKVKKWFDDNWKKIKDGFNKFCDDVEKGWDTFWSDVSKKVSDGCAKVKKWFDDNWQKIKTSFTQFCTDVKQGWDNFWSEVSKKVNDGLNAVKKFFSDAWESIKTTLTTKWNEMKTTLEKAWNDIKQKADELCENLKQFFSDAWQNIKDTWAVVKSYFQDIWDRIKSTASSLCDNLKSFFSNAWSNIKSTWDTVKGYFSGIWDSIKSTASAALENVKGYFSGAWTNIKNTWSTVTTWFGNIWTGIKNTFSNVGSWFGEKFGGAVTTIKQKWSDIKDWFAQKWESVKSVFTNAGVSIGSSITTALKNSFNNFMSKAVGKINTFIGKLNNAIDLINKIPGVNLKPIGTLQVPQLAKGGIVTGSILANIGERGREAVLPLENNTGWMDMLADRIASRNGATRVILQVDGRELGWATIDNINAITKQTGGLQLTLV